MKKGQPQMETISLFLKNHSTPDALMTRSCHANSTRTVSEVYDGSINHLPVTASTTVNITHEIQKGLVRKRHRRHPACLCKAQIAFENRLSDLFEKLVRCNRGERVERTDGEFL